MNCCSHFADCRPPTDEAKAKWIKSLPFHLIFSIYPLCVLPPYRSLLCGAHWQLYNCTPDIDIVSFLVIKSVGQPSHLLLLAIGQYDNFSSFTRSKPFIIIIIKPTLCSLCWAFLVQTYSITAVTHAIPSPASKTWFQWKSTFNIVYRCDHSPQI